MGYRKDFQNAKNKHERFNTATSQWNHCTCSKKSGKGIFFDQETSVRNWFVFTGESRTESGKERNQEDQEREGFHIKVELFRFYKKKPCIKTKGMIQY